MNADHIAVLLVFTVIRRWRRDARWKRIINSWFGSDWSQSYLAARTMRLVLPSKYLSSSYFVWWN